MNTFSIGYLFEWGYQLQKTKYTSGSKNGCGKYKELQFYFLS